MQMNFERIKEHASEKLRRIETQPVTAAERLDTFKQFIKRETQRLQLRHRFGLSGGQIAAARSLIVDLLIQRIAASAAEQLNLHLPHASLAVIALGGYGRSELAPHSDIDVMFLHQGKHEAATAAALSEKILYALWDVGFSVGHSNRSLSECLMEAKADSVTRNSLMEARLLCGSETLFEALVERLDEEVYHRQQRDWLGQLCADRSVRYERFGNVACLQEPNIKETAGGLRDLHTLLWAGRIAYGKTTLPDLVSGGMVPERDAKAMLAAYDFHLRVRNELHFLTARRTDLLTLDLQQQVARSFGYADSAHAQASEAFMRDYYLHARRLQRICDTHLQRAVATQEKRSWLQRMQHRVQRGTKTLPALGGFVLRDGMLDVAEAWPGNTPVFDGQQLLLAFSYAQATGAPLSVDLQEVMQASLPAVNKTFRATETAAQGFLKILRAKGRVAAGLRLMHELGFLGKFMPEFARVTCLVQHDLYHRFTVDEHTLRTIEVLDELAVSRSKTLERYRTLYANLSDPATLHVGLLMHDIGKGLGGGHSEKGLKIAARVCARLHLDAEACAQVFFLVKDHLLMSHIAQRRDLTDEKVVRDFAEQVGTLERLNLLTLLTYADISGVGPGVWTEWKDALIWELYGKARAVLAPDETQDDAQADLYAHVRRMLLNEVEPRAIVQHFAQLPTEYARLTAPAVIVEHIRLVQALHAHALKTTWRVNTQARCTDLHICTRNRHGLFAKLTGALTANGVNILSVSLNTRADGVVVDTFRVCDTAGEPLSDAQRWELLDEQMRRAVSGELDVASAVARRLRAAQPPPRYGKKRATPAHRILKIAWDNQSSDRSTIVEVRASDRLGLAYKLASTLAARELDIVFAKVATEKHLALDVFYITDAAGQKLADAALPPIEAAIRAALSDAVLSAQPQPQQAALRA